jgi:molybdopterin-binding protein
MANDLIRVRDAAHRLGVSYATLKQWIYKGTLRTVQTAGGHHRISESELERFLARPSTSSGRPERAEGRKGPASASAAQRRDNRRSKRVPLVLVALSGRNQLRGVVEEVRTDGLMAQIRLRIGDQLLTAIITRDAIDALRLKRGDEAMAVIKSTEVMIAKESGREESKRV